MLFYYNFGGQRIGPVSLTELNDLVKRGELNRDAEIECQSVQQIRVSDLISAGTVKPKPDNAPPFSSQFKPPCPQRDTAKLFAPILRIAKILARLLGAYSGCGIYLYFSSVLALCLIASVLAVSFLPGIVIAFVAGIISVIGLAVASFMTLFSTMIHWRAGLGDDLSAIRAYYELEETEESQS